jgi:hypothetical protein
MPIELTCSRPQPESGIHGRRTLPAWMAEEEAGEGGPNPPIALRHPAHEVHHLAGNLVVGTRNRSILLPRALAAAFGDRHPVHPAPAGRDEAEPSAAIAVPSKGDCARRGYRLAARFPTAGFPGHRSRERDEGKKRTKIEEHVATTGAIP